MKKTLVIMMLLMSGCLGTTKMGLARPDFSKPRPSTVAPVPSKSTAPVKSNSQLYERRGSIIIPMGTKQ